MASAVQHARHVRKKVYDGIDWGLDHPVLLEIKYRFNAVSTRVRGAVTASYWYYFRYRY